MAVLPAADQDDAAEFAAVETNTSDFPAAVLRALTVMAARSPRRQADLVAALRAAALPTDPSRVRAALTVLCSQGCVTNLVPLSDGGLLLTVTREALPPTQPLPKWVPHDQPDRFADRLRAFLSS